MSQIPRDQGAQQQVFVQALMNPLVATTNSLATSVASSAGGGVPRQMMDAAVCHFEIVAQVSKFLTNCLIIHPDGSKRHMAMEAFENMWPAMLSMVALVSSTSENQENVGASYCARNLRTA